MTTIETNKMIAEWMGYKKFLIDKGIEWVVIEGVLMRPRYDTSWDWLMPVVGKIEAMGYEFGINGNTAWICENESTGWLYHGWEEITKLEATHRAVVAFLEFLKK
ncbi:MAG TPA: hypothetical protein VN922_16700 [Bacteroidia bacterium]|nr:hypothetical protein [Bacteroidia bacterium]